MLKSKTNSKKIFIYSAVIGLLIFFHTLGLIAPLEGVLARVLSPVLSIFYSSGSKISIVYNDQTNKTNLNIANAELKKRNRELISENAELKTLREENDYLKKQINFRKENDYKYLLAEVVSRNDLMNNSSEDKSITINKGRKDGLEKGLVLLNSEGIIIGKIIETRESISKACLVVDKKCKFAVAIQNEDRTSGVVEGNLGLTIKMDLIPQSEDISEGDIVVSSGLENNIPRGLVIGQISEYLKENNKLWQTAVIEPLIDFDDLVMVSVILP